ncbi:MAG: hypothetical protein ACKORF_01650 [Micrococcales bacterium]
MVLKLNSHQQVLWRSPETMQIGLGDSQVTLQNVTSGQERFIDALSVGIANNQVDAVAKQSKLPAEQARELLSRLQPLLLQPAPPLTLPKRFAPKPGEPDFEPTAPAQAFTEVIRASLNHQVEAQLVMNERALRVVHIDSLDKTGLLLLDGLAAAGVGTVVTHDSELVGATDLGPDGFPTGLAGHTRFDAASLILEASQTSTRLVRGEKLKDRQLDRVDLAVLVGQQVLNPKRYSRWVNRQVPHLSLIFTTDGLEVSPVVTSGKTACLYCQHLWAQQRDSDWPVISAQLLTSSLVFDDVSSRLLGCGLVLQNALWSLDSVGGFRGSRTEVTGFVYSQKTGQLTLEKWKPHKDCACQLVLGL